jgi:hypothetical protein
MRYVFSDYTLDTQQYELRCAGALIPLRPKVFHLLAYLLAHRDRVVPRQELCDHLWPKQFVSDATLAVACFEQALDVLVQLPEYRNTLEQALDLRFDLHNALTALDEYPRVFDHLRSAEALAKRLGDDQRLVGIAGYLCSYFTHIGEHDRAIAAGQLPSPWPPPGACPTSRWYPRFPWAKHTIPGGTSGGR